MSSDSKTLASSLSGRTTGVVVALENKNSPSHEQVSLSVTRKRPNGKPLTMAKGSPKPIATEVKSQQVCDTYTYKSMNSIEASIVDISRRIRLRKYLYTRL